MTKLTCTHCKRFLGILADDGTGPWQDCDDEKCPNLEMFEKNKPKCEDKSKTYRIGKNGPGPCDDVSPGQENAIRELEDAV